jgi:hypothetical protein
MPVDCCIGKLVISGNDSPRAEGGEGITLRFRGGSWQSAGIIRQFAGDTVGDCFSSPGQRAANPHKHRAMRVGHSGVRTTEQHGSSAVARPVVVVVVVGQEDSAQAVSPLTFTEHVNRFVKLGTSLRPTSAM